jgi:sugar phosphate isomerase/epimerase
MPNILSHRVGYVTSPQLPLDRVAALGIKYLEIVMKDGESAEDVLRIIEPHGLQVSTVHAHPTPLDDAEALLGTMRQASAYAHKLGAKGFFVSMHAGEAPLEGVYALLRQVGDIVADHGLFLAMETHEDLCENGAKAAKCLGAIGHPAIGWNLDTANIYYYNHDVEVVEEARKAATLVRSIHAKDTPGGFHDPNFPNVGEGIVDFAGVAAVLDEIGFVGPWTMELEGVAGSADNVELMEANVRACAEHLRGLGVVE